MYVYIYTCVYIYTFVYISVSAKPPWQYVHEGHTSIHEFCDMRWRCLCAYKSKFSCMNAFSWPDVYCDFIVDMFILGNCSIYSIYDANMNPSVSLLVLRFTHTRLSTRLTSLWDHFERLTTNVEVKKSADGLNQLFSLVACHCFCEFVIFPTVM